MYYFTVVAYNINDLSFEHSSLIGPFATLEERETAIQNDYRTGCDQSFLVTMLRMQDGKLEQDDDRLWSTDPD